MQTNQTEKKDILTIASLNYKKFLEIIQTKEENEVKKKIIS